jgi:hypothetical protein
MTRYYTIACRCGKTASYHANGMTDDGLRKMFIRRKWDVGKAPNQHRCPDCFGLTAPTKEEPSSTPAVIHKIEEQEPPWGVAIEIAWVKSSQHHHWAFLNQMIRSLMTWGEKARTRFLDALVAALSDDERKKLATKLMPDINPVAAVVADLQHMTEHIAEPAVTLNEDTDADDVADWWKEMMEKTR